MARLTLCTSLLVLATLPTPSCSKSPDGALPGKRPRAAKPSPVMTAQVLKQLSGPALPGISKVDTVLTQRLSKAVRSKGDNYHPHSRHLHADGTAKFTNRLVETDSPYLLQHAHNPVNWYPWGAKAFSTAKASGRPILLSVGYSTCHWCHVMERESFEDETIAAYLNENYIAIKVDREQRPDIDELYMRAVQILTGRGGWPMTVVMTADRDPFFAGTYFPPEDAGRRRGFLSLLKDLRRQFTEEGVSIVAKAQRLSQQIESTVAASAAQAIPGHEPITRAFRQAKARHDATFGGFGGAPKFPRPALPDLLLRYHRRTGDPSSLDMVVRTAKAMLAGGMHDQLGGGFHRYSTDKRWLVPHFEKMLYDNAQLATLLVNTAQAAQTPELAEAARKTLHYIQREMTGPEGGFYSATDADSTTPDGKQEEGYFFTWTQDELSQTLSPQDATTVGAYYGVTARGNFEGRNILTRYVDTGTVAKQLGISHTKLKERVALATPLLMAKRATRQAPHLDDKRLAAWNGLMIGAFAQAGTALNDATLIASATRAARFVVRDMRDDEGRLMRSFRDGRATHLGYLDDYAFLISGLLDLFESTASPRFLTEALDLQAQLQMHFWSKSHGGYFSTSDAHERLIVRDRPTYDGAEPSGNSVAVMNLLRLHEITAMESYRELAEQALSAFAQQLNSRPHAMPHMLSALERYLDAPKSIFIVHPEANPSNATPGSSMAKQAQALADEVRKTYLPNRIFLQVQEGAQLEGLSKRVHGLEGKTALKGRATAYVCERWRCELPTHDARTLAKLLAKTTPWPAH